MPDSSPRHPSDVPSLADEIGQSRPFDSPGQEVIVGLMRSADEARRFMESVLEPEDVTVQQYNVLRILRGAGPEGLPTLEIGRRMIEQQPGVTRLVDRLAEKELVERRRDPEDRRRTLCTITGEGRDLLSRLQLRLEEGDARFRAGLTPEILERMIRDMDEARFALRAAHLGEDV